MEDRIKNLEQEIEKIKQRNKKVEADKAWEVSKTRISLITLLTFILTLIFFYYSGFKNYWIDAVVSTAAFVLSVQTMPLFKRWWVKRFNKKNYE